MTVANATFTVQGWDEQTYEERGPGKLTQASVQQAVTGDIEGSSDVRWIMAYTAADAAEFVGVQTVTGSVGGRSGSFVLRSVGTFDGAVAAGDLTVVAGSGTDELADISGTGSFTAPMGSEATVTLDYDLG
jgi:hypothetical protein